jgi:hypothetical protein
VSALGGLAGRLTPTPATLRGLALAAASGIAATVALLLSPSFADVGPVPLPLVPLDARLVLLPSFFPFLHLAFARTRWPLPALVLPAMALLAAGLAHWQGSVVLGLLGDLPGSGAGERVDLPRTLASGASLLLALAASLERGALRLAALARKAGVPEPQLDALAGVADAHARRTLGFAAAAFVGLALLARVGDAGLGRAQAPLAELAGAALAVGVAVLLFPGVITRRAAR